MRERTIAIGRLLALVIATALIFLPQQQPQDIKTTRHADVAQASTATPVAPAPQPTAPSLPVPQAKPVEAPKSEPPKPQPWVISASPNGGTNNVNRALAHLQSMGLTKQGAAMIVGNFLQEKPSAFVTGDPCSGTLGDGGKAHGFGQWHPGRRADMPCGFIEQLTWAIDTEMVRDHKNGGGHNLSALLRDPSATEYQLDAAIKKWERYGHKGKRFEYGVSILAQLR